MFCFCSQKVAALNQVMLGLHTNFKLNLRLDLPKLNLLVALPKIALAMKLPNLNIKIPDIRIPLGPGATALQSAGSTLMHLRMALGINLLDLKMMPQLEMLAASLAANQPSLLRLPSISITPLLDLMLVASLVLNAKANLNLKLLDDVKATAELGKIAESMAMVDANVGDFSVPPKLKSALGFALALKAAMISMGLNINDPKGPSQLAAHLNTMLQIKLPALQLNLPRINLLLTLAKAHLMAKEAFGIDLMDPKAATKLALRLEPLQLLMKLQLPKIRIKPPHLDIGGLDLQMLLNADLSGLSTSLGSMPNFSGISLIASLVASIKAAFGIDLIAKVGCGTGACPLGG